MSGEVLRTERLALSAFTEADAPFLVRLLGDPGFLRFIGDRGVRTEADARAYVAEGPRASYAAHGFGLWRVDRLGDGTSIGMCGLLQRDVLDAPDLGYAFLAEHTGQGYAREAASATLAYARAPLGLETVYAYTVADNVRSVALLTDLGFRFDRALVLSEAGTEAALYRHTRAADAPTPSAPGR
ncbi:MAG: GNAT family N-acetyltransferase [Bacteroidota bacterium]